MNKKFTFLIPIEFTSGQLNGSKGEVSLSAEPESLAMLNFFALSCKSGLSESYVDLSVEGVNIHAESITLPDGKRYSVKPEGKSIQYRISPVLNDESSLENALLCNGKKPQALREFRMSVICSRQSDESEIFCATQRINIEKFCEFLEKHISENCEPDIIEAFNRAKRLAIAATAKTANSKQIECGLGMIENILEEPQYTSMPLFSE